MAQADLDVAVDLFTPALNLNETASRIQKIDLRGANLDGTKLVSAELQKAVLAQVDEARGDRTTKLPAGLQRPSNWDSPRHAR